MPCTLDDQELALPADAANADATVGAWLEAARVQAGARGRVVVDVKLDGQALTQEQLDTGLDEPVGERQLRLLSADPAELAIEALGEARTQLAALGDLQQEAAELIQADQSGEAFAKLGGAIQGWINVATAVTQSAQINGLPLDELEAGEEKAVTIVASLSQQLHEFKDLIESGDTTALADALGYEWPEVVTKWDGLLQALATRLTPTE